MNRVRWIYTFAELAIFCLAFSATGLYWEPSSRWQLALILAGGMFIPFVIGLWLLWRNRL